MKKNTDQERLAEIIGNPDETQIVSFQDLEELEYLQLTGKDKAASAQARRTVPLGFVLGLLAALCLAVALAALSVHYGVRPAAAQAAPQESR